MKLKFFKTTEWKLMWPFYTQCILVGIFAVVTPFWIIYFKDIGLTFTEISTLLAASMISPIIFEIPTGAFADVYGRKASTLLGLFGMGIIHLLIPLTDNYYFLLLFFVLIGISFTFMSGAGEAWIIDFLRSKRQSGLIHNFYMRTTSFGAMGMVMGPFFGAILVKYLGLRPLWYIEGVGVILGGLLLLFFMEEYFIKKKINMKEGIKETTKTSKEGIKFTIKHKILFMLLIASFIGALANIGEIAWQPFLTELGMPIHYLGYFYSITGLFLIFSPYLSKPLKRLIKHPPKLFALITFIMMSLVALLYFVNFPYYQVAIIIIILATIIVVAEEPIYLTYRQSFIPSKIRATVGSARSMVLSIAGVIALLVGGRLMDIVGPKMTIIYLNFLFIIPVIIYLKIKDKTN